MRKSFITFIMAITILFGSLTPAYAVGVSSENKKVQWLIDKGHVVGRAEQGLELDKTITRAEFAKMVVVIEGGEDKAQSLQSKVSVFSDVSPEHWANGYINQATQMKYIKGMEDGTFQPEKMISYNEVITILSRLHICFKEDTIESKDWAEQYVTFAKKYEILKEVEIKGDFNTQAIRELAFELVYNLYHSSKDCKVVKPSDPIVSPAPFWPIGPWIQIPDVDNKEVRLVTYNVDGKLYTFERVLDGEKANKPADPVKEGYTFVAWYNGDKVFDFNSPITKDITLEAKFTEKVVKPDPVKKQYKITFNVEGNTSIVPAQTVAENAMATEPTAPTKEGFVFKEWQFNGVAYDFTTPVRGNITLTAVFEKAPVITEVVAPLIDGAKSIKVKAEDVKKGDTFKILANGVEVGSYTIPFDGNTSRSISLNQPLKEGQKVLVVIERAGTQVASSEELPVEAAPIVNYTVTFDVEGNTSIVPAQTVAENATATEPAAPTKEGFVFKEWQFNGVAYNFATPVTGDITLTAVFEPKQEEGIVSGQYVLVDTNNQVPGILEGTWVTRSDAAEDPTTMTGSIMTLEINGDQVKIKDSNGNYLAPKGGDNNGIKSGEYNWLLVKNEDGTYSFKGQGADTVEFANNTDFNGSGYRAYKNTTIESKKYPSDFQLVKVGEVTEEQPKDPAEETLLTIAEARAASGQVTTQGIVTFLDGRNITIQDETGGIVVRLETFDHGYVLGDKIQATGTRGVFNNLEQINGTVAETKKVSSANPLPNPKEVTVAELKANGEAYESQRVLVKDVEIGSEANSNTPLSQNGQTINIYKLDPQFAVAPSSTANVTAVVGQYGNDYQLRVAEKEDIEVITPGQGPLPSGEFTKINAIQGTTLQSPMNGQDVEIKGVVITGTQDRYNKGYYIHSLKEDMDADQRTSEAIFVETNYTGVNRGDIVTVKGVVDERKYMSSYEDDLTVTSLKGAFVTNTTEKYSEAQLDELVTQVSVTQIPSIVSNQQFDKASHGTITIDPTDAIGFYESLECMPVKLSQPEIVAQVEEYGDITVLPDRGLGADVLRTATHGVKYTYDTPNVQKITISDKIIPITSNKSYTDPAFKPYPGKYFNGDVEGVFVYAFADVKLLNYKPLPSLAGQGIMPEGPSELRSDANSITATIYNVLNFSAKDTDRAPIIAGQIVNKLNSPDLVALVEIQDNDGTGTGAGQDASQTIELLIREIAAAGGPNYEYVNIDPQPGNVEGGAPNANIRPAFLYNPAKLKLAPSVEGRASSPSETIQVVNNGGVMLQQNPSRLGHNLDAFASTRLPLVAQFEIQQGPDAGQKITFINNHLSSKRGDTPIIGPFQPQVRGSEAKRHIQAETIANLVNEIRAINPNEHVVVMGDLNDYEFSETLGILESKASLANLIENLPEDNRSSYIFQGNSQVLDHILVSPSINALAPQVDMLNINAGFTADDGRASDHDPVLTKMTFQ